jgi:hypothetical protein
VVDPKGNPKDKRQLADFSICLRFAWLMIGGTMSTLSQIEKISEKYDISTDNFIRSGAILNLKEKQRLN